MRPLFLSVIPALFLAGCQAAPAGPDPAPSDPAPSESVVTVVPIPERSEMPAPTPRPKADPALVASMECEPLSAVLEGPIESLMGGATRSVQVEVGEGNTPGEIWWVVALDMPAYEQTKAGLSTYLTNAPGHMGGTWIPIGVATDPVDHQGVIPDLPGAWRNVDWDYDRLVRGHSALAKAVECLNG